jgi:predicted RNA binding protein YcfA (HicA-like mRNA interferase family)
MKARKVLEKILSGSRNIRFEDTCRLAKALGFELDRTRGSHHIFVHREVPGLRMNFQPDKGGQMKVYQVRQLLDAMEMNGLRLDDEL